MHKRCHVKYRYSSHILTKLEFSPPTDFLLMVTNIKFRGFLSGGIRVVPCGQTDMTKLIVAFHKFANALKNAFYAKLIIYIYIVGESNGKLPPRTCPGCSLPEPYRSHEWALVPANPASKAEY